MKIFSAKEVSNVEIVYISDDDDDNTPIIPRENQNIILSQWAPDRTIENLEPENEQCDLLNFVENQQCNFSHDLINSTVFENEIFQSKSDFNFAHGAEEDLENALDGKLCELEIENTAFDLSSEYADIMAARKNGSNLLDEDEVLENEIKTMELTDILIASEGPITVVLENGHLPGDPDTQRRIFDFHTANAIRSLRADLDDVSIRTLTDCFFKAVPKSPKED